MKLVLAMAVGLVLTPAAYAQATCAEVRRVISESKDDFDAITGDEIDDDLYKATYRLGGATECSINYEFDSVYSCSYQVESYAAAYAAWSSHANAVSSCLAGWTASSVPPASATADGYRTLTGTLYAGSGADADLEWAVVLEEHIDTTGTHHHIWVELAYFW